MKKSNKYSTAQQLLNEEKLQREKGCITIEFSYKKLKKVLNIRSQIKGTTTTINFSG